MQMNETENQTRLRRAKEALEQCRTREKELRVDLAAAVESTKRAKSRYEELFLEEERLETDRLKRTYSHCTK